MLEKYIDVLPFLKTSTLSIVISMSLHLYSTHRCKSPKILIF